MTQPPDPTAPVNETSPSDLLQNFIVQATKPGKLYDEVLAMSSTDAQTILNNIYQVCIIMYTV